MLSTPSKIVCKFICALNYVQCLGRALYNFEKVLSEFQKGKMPGI